MHRSIGLLNKKKIISKVRRTGNIKKRCSKIEGILKSSIVYKIVLILSCISAEIIKKAEKRKEAKANKDWTRADVLRDEITAAGFLVEDTPDGYRIKRK